MTAYEKFNEIKTAYLSSLVTIAKSKDTYEKYKTVLNNFAKWLKQNDSEESDVAAVKIINYSKTVKERGDKSNTLRHYLIILRSFFNWCINHKFYTEQPVLKEDMPKQERIEYNLLTEEQIETILRGDIPKWSKMATAKRNRALVILLIQSGLRVSELAHLKIEDLDFEQHSIRVSHGKGDKFRYTTFPELSDRFVGEYLEERHSGNCGGESGLLFENNGKPFTRQGITTLVRAYVKRAVGRNDIGSHDLRHAYASWLITHGTELEQIQALLGHSSYATTVIYASHLCPKRISQNANNVWNARL